MNNLDTIKNLVAASALVLMAGFAHAQAVPVTGTFRVSDCTPSNNAVTGSIDIDQTGSSLAYLYNVTIATSGYTCGGRSYGWGFWTTSLYSVDHLFPGSINAVAPAGLPEWTDPTVEYPNGTWGVIYLWGDHSDDSNAAGAFSGSFSGSANDPDWDAAALSVTVDGVTYAPIDITLITWEYDLPAYWVTEYTLIP